MSTTVRRRAPARTPAAAPRQQASRTPQQPAKKPAPKPAAKPAPPPQAAATRPPAQPAKKQGGGGFLDNLGLGGITDRLRAVANPPLTDQQRTALNGVRDMLAPDRLGGQDGTFNFADRDAVVSSLLRDTRGLSRETQAQLRAEGRNFAANQARRGLAGQRGILPRIARNQVYNEAPGRIRGQVEAGLRAAEIDPGTGANPDPTRRNVTFADMRRFEEHARTLQQLQTQTEDRLNVDITFPEGPSRAAIDFMLEGRIGIPPGAVITPRRRR